MRHLRTRLSTLLHRRRCERELDSELQFHLDMLTELHVRGGMTPAEARRAALQSFGRPERIKEDVRDSWLARLVETCAQDLRSGVRALARSRGFACAVILTMALGIGANTAMFSIVHGVVLKPLPYAHGDRLVVLRHEGPPGSPMNPRFSYQEILDLRGANSLEAVVEFHEMWFVLLGRPEPERVATGVVSAGLFDALGVRPLHGRHLQDSDERPGAPAVLVLSHAYWLRAFGGDPSVVGRMFEMNDRPHQVVGVLPPVTPYPAAVDVYMPTSACPFRSSPETVRERDRRMSIVIARAREGVPLGRVQADLGILAGRLQRDFPAHYPGEGYRITASPLQSELTRNFSTMLLVLAGTTGFILLIVCASIGNLTLARMLSRDREMSVRTALGAGRVRLLRQLLTEGALLALAGGVLGLGLAAWCFDLLVSFTDRFTPRAREISLDRTVLVYAFLMSACTGLVAGAVPAFGLGRGGPASGTRTTLRRERVRSSLIVVQVAASFMLLIGAGLTTRSLLKLQQVDPGIRTDNVLTMRVDLNFTNYPPGRRAAFWEELERRLERLPGATSVGGAGTFPFNEQGPFSSSLIVGGRAVPAQDVRPRVNVRLATPGYFATVGLPLLAGRAFTRADRAGTPFVAIINETMARHYWPGASAIGARVSGDGGTTWSTIVGIVADSRQQLNQEPGDEVYVAMFQSGQLSTNWLVRTATDHTTMAHAVRRAVHALDPAQPVDQFRTLDEVRAASLVPPTLTATLLGLFGLLALIITAAGIAGVVAFSVNMRTQEFGVRMALGAQPGNVLAMVLRQGLQLVLLGLALGLPAALVLSDVLSTLLFGIEPTDGLTFAAVAMVLVAAAVLACLVPARRAATVNPMVALRAT